MRYADGGGLTAAGRAKREAVRFEAAEGPYGTEHVDSHAPILRVRGRLRPTVLIGC
nr:hypothetical protein [Streptomyces malaysiense]